MRHISTFELAERYTPVRSAHKSDFPCAQLLTAQDLVESAEVPWFFPIDATAWRWEMPQTTALGRRASRTFAWCLERIGIAPRGTSEVSDFLEKGADGLCEGGRTGIFTPLYLIVARKPGGGK